MFVLKFNLKSHEEVYFYLITWLQYWIVWTILLGTNKPLLENCLIWNFLKLSWNTEYNACSVQYILIHPLSENRNFSGMDLRPVCKSKFVCYGLVIKLTIFRTSWGWAGPSSAQIGTGTGFIKFKFCCIKLMNKNTNTY